MMEEPAAMMEELPDSCYDGALMEEPAAMTFALAFCFCTPRAIVSPCERRESKSVAVPSPVDRQRLPRQLLSAEPPWRPGATPRRRSRGGIATTIFEVFSS